jgi:hypothetical protein
MKKRRLAFTLALGLVLALFVSACGVAVGPVQFTPDGRALLNPTLSGLHLPGLSGKTQPAMMGSMYHLQYLTTSSQSLALDAYGVGSCHGQP